LKQAVEHANVNESVTSSRGPAGLIIRATLLGALLGCAGGLDLFLAGYNSSGGLVWALAAGAVIGAGLAILLSILHVRSEAASGAHPPQHVWPLLIGVLTLLLSVASFITTQLVPGVRPLVVASAPIHLDRADTVTLKFTADSAAPYAVELALGVDRVAKAMKDLGLQGKQRAVEQPLPPPTSIQWTSDVPTSKKDKVEQVFDPAESRLVGLGSVDAVEGRTYTLTARVAMPFPSAEVTKPRLEVHRTMAGWGRYFPRMLVAGVLGLLEGIVGLMLLVYGGVLRYSAPK
jgi:hypothetical protein